MEVAKISIVKSLIAIIAFLMLAFIPQINHAAQFNQPFVEQTNIEKYWASWYYWHRWRDSFGSGERYCYNHYYQQKNLYF